MMKYIPFISNHKHVRYVVVVVAITLIIIFRSIIGYYNHKAANTLPVVHITVAPVKQEDVPFEVQLVGTVYAYETVAIKSRLDSQVLAVRFRDGDTVHEGDVLFELDGSLLNTQLNQYEANLARDQAQLRNAKSQYERYLKLGKSGYASHEQLEQAKATFDAQGATVKSTQATIDNIKAQLNYTTIKAPITGRAGTINVTRGNTVKANDTGALVTINQIKPIRVQFAVPDRYFDKLHTAMSEGEIVVRAFRSDGSITSEGTLEYIDNEVNAGTGTFNARAVFKNDDEKLWPGMFVNVNMALGVDKDALVIPKVAVQNNQNQTFVFLVDEAEKKVVKRVVTIIRDTDDTTVVKDGLQPGDRVAVDGILRLTDGAGVEIDADKPSVPSDEGIGDR